MLSWAKETGWLIDPDDLQARLGLANEHDGGDEHDVWYDELTGRAIKLTLDDKFVAGSPAAYCLNLQRQNQQFDAGFTFEGVENDESIARFVITQPWIMGERGSLLAKIALSNKKTKDEPGEAELCQNAPVQTAPQSGMGGTNISCVDERRADRESRETT